MAPNQGAKQFEIRWMENMIDHHHMAVMMGESCLEKATHEELKELCQEVITRQSAEIQQLRTWLCEWYNRCKPPMMMH